MQEQAVRRDNAFAVLGKLLHRAADEIEKALIGKRDVVEKLLVCLITGGHALIEDVPGVGKTTLAHALAKVTSLEYNRIQFTPDTMPSDVTGFMMYRQDKQDFIYHKGVAICNLLLADEINRALPRTQSSLLEVMEEGAVTVDSVVHPVPQPFLVIATQNPLGFVGTHPLPEAQLDRFFMKLTIGYPSMLEEIGILTDRQQANPLDSLRPVLTRDQVLTVRSYCRQVYLDDSIKSYIVRLISATRNNPDILLAASPRASLALMRAAQANAMLSGRYYCIPEDVGRYVGNVLSHRLVLSQQARMERRTVEQVIAELVQSVPVPFFRPGR